MSFFLVAFAVSLGRWGCFVLVGGSGLTELTEGCGYKAIILETPDEMKSLFLTEVTSSWAEGKENAVRADKS